MLIYLFNNKYKQNIYLHKYKFKRIRKKTLTQDSHF